MLKRSIDRFFYHSFSGCAALLSLLLLSACGGGGQPPAAMQGIIRAPERVESPAPAQHAAIKVALLAPFEGVSASMLDAAQLAMSDKGAALGDAGRVSASIEILPKDTSQGAGQAAREALNEGAKLIIGPISSVETSEVAPLARAKRVPVLSFSNNRQAAGSGVYLLGFLPGEQVMRVASFAAGRGIQQVGALLPQDAYGKTVEQALRASAKGGLQLGPIAYYQPSSASVEAAVAKVAPMFQQPYAALLVPESGERLGLVMESLNAAGFDPSRTKLLGTGQWDNPDLARYPLLQGAWFASSPPEFTERFDRHFRNAFGYNPTRLASLAYDATALASAIAINQGEFTGAVLTDSSGFAAPANGAFRFRHDGTAERLLSVLEITSGGRRVVDPAPAAF